MHRRYFLFSVAGLAVSAVGSRAAWAQPDAVVEVWKDPACGCCGDWVEHLRANGFLVRLHDSGNAVARARLGIPDPLGSCHTALVGGYAVEGHVPARDIRRMLRERPVAVGLAVPGMPIGAPGMDGAVYGGRHDPFNVLLVQRDGHTAVYQHYA